MPHRDDFDDDFSDTSSDAYDYKPVASDETGGGKAVKIFLSVTVIAGIAAAAWYFVGDSKTAGDDIPVVRADTSQIKEKPNDPGGMAVPNRDKTVYDRVGDLNSEPKLERLLPHPEKPLEKPTLGMAIPELDEKIDPKTGLPVISKPIPPAPVTVQKVTPPTNTPLADNVIEKAKVLPDTPAEEMAKNIEAPEPAPQVGANSPRALVKRGNVPTGPDKQDKDELAAKIKEALMEPMPKPEKNIEIAKVEPKKTPTAKSKEPIKKGFLLQLLSSKSESAVKASWKKIKANNAKIVKSIPVNIVRADLGPEKGIYYRLRLGPVATGDAAKSLCSQLKKKKVGCYIVRVR